MKDQSKAGFDKKDDKMKDKADTDKVGVTLRSELIKGRLSMPNTIRLYLNFYKGVNQFTGLEEYVSWERCGVEKGNIEWIPEDKKLKSDDETVVTDVVNDGKRLIFHRNPKAHNYAVRDLLDTVKGKDFFSSKVFTPNVLNELDAHIQSVFKYDDIDDGNLLELLEDDADAKIETVE